MDENKTKYSLELDAQSTIDQLREIHKLVTQLDKIITQQSGETYAIDVQIKNADITNVFEKLEKAIGRSEEHTKSLGEAIERILGKDNALKKLEKTIGAYDDTIKKSTKNLKSIADNTGEAIAETYRKNSNEALKFINRAGKEAKKMSGTVAASYSTMIRSVKKDLQTLGIDTSNMSAKDLENWYTKLNKVFGRRQMVQGVNKTLKDSLEKVIDGVSGKFVKSAESVVKQTKKTAVKEMEKYEQERVLAATKTQQIIDKQAEKDEQRTIRRQLYGKNVAEASRMLAAQVAEGGSNEEQKLTSQYNRAVQRIRGIYQSAVKYGRVESPQTILAGLTELQQRSLALTNYKLSEQMGINELNDKLKTTVKRMEDMGTTMNKVSSVIQNSVQAFSTLQSYAYNITSKITSFAKSTLSQITSKVSTLVSESTEAFKSLEVSMIGFRNFFGDEMSDKLYQRIKNIAAEAPGLGTTDLAEYVRQIAPVSKHNADLALDASLGMLKTIQYGGASGSSEMEYVIKNIRDVISKGEATKIDVRQFNRAMPILEEVLGSVGQSQLLKDGELTINKDNVDTILSAFAALNNSNQSAVKDIFNEMNQTLSGQWEQFTEQLTTNLMGVLRGSQVYGGVQNLLGQINSGEYVNTGLRKLQEALTQFINNINWFKLQRIAGEFWEGMKIVWEGVQDAAKNITEALGKTNSGNVIHSFASWIADIIRGIGDGITQVIKFLQYLERTGVMNHISRAIGWLGSVGSQLTLLLGTMVSHLTNIMGNAAQLLAKFQKTRILKQLASANAQLEAIPLIARSQIATGSDLLNGTGIASVDSAETAAIQNLTSLVNSHLTKIEANQTGRTSTLGRAETALNNGKRYVWMDDFDGAGHGALGTWNKKTKEYDWQGFSNNDLGYKEYQRMITQNRLQASKYSFVQAIGNNKYVNSVLKWMKQAGKTIMSYIQKFFKNMETAGIVTMITTALSGVIESLDLFGENTVYIAGILKTAGLAISGAIMGSTFGVAGGVVGALIGLGVGINDLIKSVKAKADEMTNTKITQALDEERQGILNQIKEALIKNGALEADLGKRNNEQSYALQQLSNVIANSSTTELESLGARGLADIYGDALRYKTIQENFTNKNSGNGYDWTQHATGVEVTKDNREYLKKIYDAVNKYDLLASHGYSQGIVDGQRVYVDSGGNAISAETIWDEFFNTQEGLDTVTSGQIDDMEAYLRTQEQEQMDEWTEIENKLEKISTTPGMSWYDLIDARLREANNHLFAIQSANPTKEGMSAVYGQNAANSFAAFQESSGNLGNWFSTSNLKGMAAEAASPFGPNKQSYNDILHEFEKKTGFSYNDDTASKLAALIKWARANNIDESALSYEDMTANDINRIYDLLASGMLDKVSPATVLNKLYDSIQSTGDENKKSTLSSAMEDIKEFQLNSGLQNLFWWLRVLLRNESRIGDGYRFFARGGFITPASRGIDTVPAMLSPGEFVMKQSAVKKAGLGVMHALNHGDLGLAARALAGNVSNNWYRNNNASINNSRNSKTNINNIRIINRNNSARLNSYYSLANRLSF